VGVGPLKLKNFTQLQINAPYRRIPCSILFEIFSFYEEYHGQLHIMGPLLMPNLAAIGEGDGVEEPPKLENFLLKI